jgi:hypothetical protein
MNIDDQGIRIREQISTPKPTGGAKDEMPSFQFTGEGHRIACNVTVGVI